MIYLPFDEQWADKIVSGQKTIELRKGSAPSQKIEHILLYVSKKSYALGVIEIKRVTQYSDTKNNIHLNIKDVVSCSDTLNKLFASKRDVLEYSRYNNKKYNQKEYELERKCHLFHINNFISFDKPVSLEVIKKNTGLRNFQGMTYLGINDTKFFSDRLELKIREKI